MLPDPIWRAQLNPGPHRILLALWDYAGWRPGCGDTWAFVWPSVETIASKLGTTASTVYRGLAQLRREGWIAQAQEQVKSKGVTTTRAGWRLFLEPKGTDDPDAKRRQWPGDGPEQGEISFPAGAGGDTTAEDPSSENSEGREGSFATSRQKIRDLRNPILTGSGSEPSRNVAAPAKHDDDDEGRIWSEYEEARVRMLGGEHRGVATAPRRAAIRSLIRAVADTLGGNRAAALSKVRRYALGSLETTAAAVRGKRDCATRLVAARADGREWSFERYQATMARLTAEQASATTRREPEPDPLVDGVRVDLHEREVYLGGGDEAVRREREQRLGFEQIASLSQGILDRMRGKTADREVTT